jgi:hypothetical protein
VNSREKIARMNANSWTPFIKLPPGAILKHLVIAVLLIASALRLAYFFIDFSVNSLQIDFSAFYTAGEALNHGLSPYTNNIAHSPPIWDGINDYQHSRFLYPPLAANLFQPIALLPYFYAKIFWGIFTLLCLLLALYVTSRIFAIEKFNQLLLLGICICWYYPLLTHLERGQIDTVTLLLLIVSIDFMIKKGKMQEGLAGVFLATAVLLKLHSIYIFPFLIARKNWRALKGFLIAISVILAASLSTHNGRALLKDYLVHEMPRIANYGRPDHGDLLLDTKLIQAKIRDLPNGYTIKDGYLYQPVSLNFVSNATLVRPIHDRLNSSGLNLDFAVLSFAIFVLFFLTLLVWQYYFYPRGEPAPERDFLYWQAILIVILLSAPMTHVMNTVWMLPVFVMIIASYSNLNKVAQKLGYGMLVAGIVLVGMPDTLYFDLLSLFTLHWMNDKYLIGEAFVLIGCLFYLSEPISRRFCSTLFSSQKMSEKTARSHGGTVG